MRPRDARVLRALIRLPSIIDRFVRLPDLGQTGTARFIAIEQVIVLFTSRLFPGYLVKGQGGFRWCAIPTSRSRRRPRTWCATSRRR